jgi:uncharacterized protein (TIGR00255 family)
MREMKRGKVDCSVSLRSAQSGGAALDLDHTALERLIASMREIASLAGERPVINPMDLLRWPGVVRESEGTAEEVLQSARDLFSATVAELVAARAREGSRLRELIEQRCVGLDALVVQVKARLPEARARWRAKVQERLTELRANIDSERLEQELALMLQRADAAEELDRLAGHIAETRRVVASDEPAGRRLDFLMQELHREANTLSSKSQDMDTTRAAVDMKVLIEQMREQVQNIE